MHFHIICSAHEDICYYHVNSWLPNAWVYPMEELPNEEYELQESGLMGPVKILFTRKVDF